MRIVFLSRGGATESAPVPRPLNELSLPSYIPSGAVYTPTATSLLVGGSPVIDGRVVLSNILRELNNV